MHTLLVFVTLFAGLAWGANVLTVARADESSVLGLPPQKVAFFNTPVGSAGEGVSTVSSITAAVINLIDAAAPGATIRIAMYYMQKSSLNIPSEVDLIGQSLKAALLRGVRVLVVSGNEFSDCDSNTRNYFCELKNDPVPIPDSIESAEVRYCRPACFSAGLEDKMHNKFLLVNNTVWTPEMEYVVLQMTSNWSAGQLSSKFYNSAVQVWGDFGLHNGYRNYFEELVDCAETSADHCPGDTPVLWRSGDAGSGTSVDLFPKPGGADDPLLSQLQSVGCTYQNQPGAIEVAMGIWSANPRGIAILDELEELDAQGGCLVRIVVADGQPIVDHLSDADFKLKPHCGGLDTYLSDAPSELPTEVAGLEDPAPPVHSKYVLIRGRYEGQQNNHVVLTGSMNISHGALYDNDETWMEFKSTTGAIVPVIAENVALHAQYSAQFDALWAATPPCAVP